MTETALAKRTPDVERVQALGKLMAESGFFADSRGMAQAAVKVLAGEELGIPPVAAMRGLHIVEGKIELSGTLIAALIRRSGKYDYRVTENTDATCTVEFFATLIASADRESIGSTTWTLDDAVRAGLCSIKDGKPHARSTRGNPLPWEQYTRAMLFNRAMAEGARTHVPDVFDGPVYSEGEIEAVASSEVEVTPKPSANPPADSSTGAVSTSSEPSPVDSPEVLDGEIVEETDGAETGGAKPEASVATAPGSAPTADDIDALIATLGRTAGWGVLLCRKKEIDPKRGSNRWGEMTDDQRTALYAAMEAEGAKKE